jgi:hypothetical protein
VTQRNEEAIEENEEDGFINLSQGVYCPPILKQEQNKQQFGFNSQCLQKVGLG